METAIGRAGDGLWWVFRRAVKLVARVVLPEPGTPDMAIRNRCEGAVSRYLSVGWRVNGDRRSTRDGMW